MKIPYGYPSYGQNVGILVFNQPSPRIPGDAGHNGSFRYPVRYQVVEGGFAQLIDGSPEILQNLLDACDALKAQGASAIVGDCGMMSLYQREMAAHVGLPVLASSLCAIPFVWQIIGRCGTIGIVTGHSGLLSERHLRASGWDDSISITLQGLQEEPHFSEIVINGGKELDPVRMEADLLHAVEKLTARCPDLKAIVLECSNIGSFSKAIYERFGIPVFDVISLCNLVEYAVNPPAYY